MQYIRTTTKQEAVEADSPEEAQTSQTANTIDIVVRVVPRPTQPIQAGRAPGSFPAIPRPNLPDKKV